MNKNNSKSSNIGKVLEIMRLEEDSPLTVKLFESRIQAGFPSPAQGSFADSVDLNRELISNPAATFCARVIGDSMIDVGINDGDMLIIDRSIEPRDGDIAVCHVDGDFTVKRLKVTPGGVDLVPANDHYPTLHVSRDNDFVVWGVVSHIIKKIN